ncbi:hypothetical protein Bca4012_061183 [Brassica carinata]
MEVKPVTRLVKKSAEFELLILMVSLLLHDDGGSLKESMVAADYVSMSRCMDWFQHSFLPLDEFFHS